MTLEILEKGPGFYVPVLLLSLLITTTIYAFFPILFSIIRKKRITARKYRVYCYFFNFFVMILFTTFYGRSSSAPYIIWTSVFCHFGLKILERRNVIEDNYSSCGKNSESSLELSENNNNGSNTDLYTVLQKKSKSRFCKFCGSSIDPYTKKCTGCGRQYFHVRISALCVLSIVLLVSTITLSSILISNGNRNEVTVSRLKAQITDLEQDIENKNKEIQDLDEQLNKKTAFCQQLISERDTLSFQVDFFKENIVFVSIDDSATYHKYDCYLFTYSRYTSKKYWAYNIELAESNGIRPCEHCFV